MSDSIRNNSVSISMFNRGYAGRIFEDLKHTGRKIVYKNNKPECVLLSIDEYERLIDEIEDMKLAMIAAERLKNFNPDKLISDEEMMAGLGITQEEIDNMEEAEFE